MGTMNDKIECVVDMFNSECREGRLAIKAKIQVDLIIAMQTLEAIKELEAHEEKEKKEQKKIGVL